MRVRKSAQERRQEIVTAALVLIDNGRALAAITAPIVHLFKRAMIAEVERRSGAFCPDVDCVVTSLTHSANRTVLRNQRGFGGRRFTGVHEGGAHEPA